jgi:hypothetical protein
MLQRTSWGSNSLTKIYQEPLWNEIRLEYSRKLLAMFLAGHPNHQLVFMRIWQIEPSYLTDAFRDFYEENPLNITRILDVAQDLKVRSCFPYISPDLGLMIVFRYSKPFSKSGPSFLPLMLLPLLHGENTLTWTSGLQTTCLITGASSCTPLSSSSNKRWRAKRHPEYLTLLLKIALCLSAQTPSPSSYVSSATGQLVVILT